MTTKINKLGLRYILSQLNYPSNHFRFQSFDISILVRVPVSRHSIW